MGIERNEQRIMLVKPRPGILVDGRPIGETRRVVHVVVLDGEQLEDVDTLTTVCGSRFAPGDVEQLETPRGMPCTACLAYSPPPVEQQPIEVFPQLRRLSR